MIIYGHPVSGWRVIKSLIAAALILWAIIWLWPAVEPLNQIVMEMRND